MGFNKRIVYKENIIRTPESELEKLFNADALITDLWSGKFIEYFQKGYNKEEIIHLLQDEEN